MHLKTFRIRSSFSRDFFVLAAAVTFLLLLLTFWIAYDTYRDHQHSLVEQMDVYSSRMDRTLVQDIEQASYLLESISRQIPHVKTENLTSIARLLRSFDTENTVFNLFGWVDNQQRIVVTNTNGVLTYPQDVSDRDYIKKSISMPAKVHIGRPVQGRASNKWVIPLALGINDAQGKYLGTVLISINIEKLTTQLRAVLDAPDISFGLLTSTLIEVVNAGAMPDFLSGYFPLESLYAINFEEHPQGKFKPIYNKDNQGMLTYYQHSSGYPFVFLMGTNLMLQLKPLLMTLWQRLMPLLLIAIFSAIVLFVIRYRVIQPLTMLGEEAEKLIRGEALTKRVKGPSEITKLGERLQQISAYIQERRRIEFEQKAKLTFLKRAKDSAEVSSRVKVDFLTSMSHEFRTPLNTVSGFIELMKNEVYGAIGNERYRQYVTDIHDSVNALQSLVSDVISLSKAESSQADVQEKPLELQLVVARSIRNLADKLKEAGVTVENRVREDLPKLRVDESRLRQVIQNLLFNALSHTPMGGSIVVEARVAEDKLHQPVFEIIITDFGAKRLPGSREEEGDMAMRKGKKGYGAKPGNLGVPLTKALVAMQQATLEVDSPPGKATTVTVRYPKEKIVL
jgi:signal transduction histidine kinase